MNHTLRYSPARLNSVAVCAHTLLKRLINISQAHVLHPGINKMIECNLDAVIACVAYSAQLLATTSARMHGSPFMELDNFAILSVMFRAPKTDNSTHRN